MSNVIPRIGDWYRNQLQQEFEVVACDMEEGTVEIQYFDGDIEELEIDAWKDLVLEPIDAPEDWSGPFDGIGLEEMSEGDSKVFAGGLDEVLDDFDRND